jgi:hypothetical protein
MFLAGDFVESIAKGVKEESVGGEDRAVEIELNRRLRAVKRFESRTIQGAAARKELHNDFSIL